MLNLKKLHPKVRSRIYKERLETMPEHLKKKIRLNLDKPLDKDKQACYSYNKINNMKAKDLKPVTPTDKISKSLLDRASTQTDLDVCDECGSLLHEHIELREGNYMEILRECFGCGSLQT